MTPRRVYRSSTNKLPFGVAGGLGEYFAVDPVLVRVGFLFLCIVSAGGAILFYLLLAIVIPRGEATSAGTLEATDYPGRINSLMIVTLVVGALIFCALLILVGLAASFRFFG